MMQMFLLSILFNVLAGLILLNTRKQTEKVTEKDESKIEDLSKKQKILEGIRKSISESEVLSNKTFTLVIGILSMLTGVCKFFCVAKDGLLILGDLLPAIMGIAAGFAILLNYYLSTASVENNLPKPVKLIFIDNIYWVGISCFIVAFLHFIMPGVLFF